MSYDLKLVESEEGTYKDIMIGDKGKLTTVTNRDKLIQDIYKLFLTPLGANKFHLRYGCALDYLIGRKNIKFELNKLAQILVSEALRYLSDLQKIQETEQYVSEEERLIEVVSIEGG